MATFIATMLMLTGIFMILLILVQRGRGGGLAGAFGGMGGQSAFGTKAGDVFTKITVAVAIVWVVLAGASILFMRNAASGNFSGGDDVEVGAGAGSIPGSGDGDSDTPPLTTKGDEGETSGEEESSNGEDASKNSESTPAEENPTKTDE